MNINKLQYDLYGRVSREGTELYVIRDSSGVDQITGVRTPVSPERHKSKGIISRAVSKDWPGSVVVTNKLQILLSAYPFHQSIPEFMPRVTDKIQVVRDIYTIQELQRISPKGLTLFYRVLVTI